jgi:hypothetical protein
MNVQKAAMVERTTSRGERWADSSRRTARFIRAATRSDSAVTSPALSPKWE